MTEAPTEITFTELAGKLDETPACDIDDCDDVATHRLVHIPCGWSGVLLCTRHAEIVSKYRAALGVTLTILLGRCRGCRKRIIGTKSYKVVPL